MQAQRKSMCDWRGIGRWSRWGNNQTIAPGAPGRGHRQSRRLDDLLAGGGQPGQRQNWSRFARRRVQRRLLEPEIKLATAAVAWERLCWRLAFRTVCRTGNLDMKMLGMTIPGTHLVEPGAISSGRTAQRLLDRGID